MKLYEVPSERFPNCRLPILIMTPTTCFLCQLTPHLFCSTLYGADIGIWTLDNVLQLSEILVLMRCRLFLRCTLLFRGALHGAIHHTFILNIVQRLYHAPLL